MIYTLADIPPTQSLTFMIWSQIGKRYFGLFYTVLVCVKRVIGLKFIGSNLTQLVCVKRVIGLKFIGSNHKSFGVCNQTFMVIVWTP